MLRRVGGHPALDFVNTVDPRDGEERTDYLHAFDDLVEWAVRGGVLTPQVARAVRTEGHRSPAAASAALSRAIELREALYTIFGRLASARRAPAAALQVLESAYRDAMTHAHLTAARPVFQWHLPAALDVVRWEIAREAIGLLQSIRASRIKRCSAATDCGWLFLDASKNGSRRWCSMEGCGNRAKVRRFASRHRRRHA